MIFYRERKRVVVLLSEEINLLEVGIRKMSL